MAEQNIDPYLEYFGVSLFHEKVSKCRFQLSDLFTGKHGNGVVHSTVIESAVRLVEQLYKNFTLKRIEISQEEISKVDLYKLKINNSNLNTVELIYNERTDEEVISYKILISRVIDCINPTITLNEQFKLAYKQKITESCKMFINLIDRIINCEELTDGCKACVKNCSRCIRCKNRTFNNIIADLRKLIKEGKELGLINS